MDAMAATGMIEENPFFHRAGAHLAVFAEVNCGLREAVGLAAGVDAVHVGFVFVGSRLGVLDGREDKAKNREDQQYQGKYSDIADAAYLPFLSPPFQRPLER